MDQNLSSGPQHWSELLMSELKYDPKRDEIKLVHINMFASGSPNYKREI